MKLLQIASGDFFSTYGGGQVYVKNLVAGCPVRLIRIIERTSSMCNTFIV